MLRILKSYSIPHNIIHAIALTYTDNYAKVITPDGGRKISNNKGFLAR